MDRGDKESTTDRDRTTTTTMNERGAKLGRIAPLPPELEKGGSILAESNMRNMEWESPSTLFKGR